MTAGHFSNLKCKTHNCKSTHMHRVIKTFTFNKRIVKDIVTSIKTVFQLKAVRHISAFFHNLSDTQQKANSSLGNHY